MQQPFSYFSKAQIELAENISNFAEKNIKPLAKSIEKNQQIPADLWLKLGQNGYLGITAPKSYGGKNLGYLAQCIVMSKISAACASVGLSYSAHANLCINQLVRFANQNQAKHYLPKLISGQWLGALAISEEQAGSDAMSMQLTATKIDGGYILTGQKKWITNAPDADVLVVYAKMAKAENSKTKLSTFIVDKSLANWSAGPLISKMGMHGSKTSTIKFNNCFVPSINVLGELDRGSNIMMSGLDYERAVLAAGPLGIIEHCLATTLAYITKREQFGKKIGEFQLIQAKLADMYTQYQAARSLVFSTANACDQGMADSADCAASILFASESATKIALETIQALGGNGYTIDFPAAGLLNDAKLYEIGAGTAEIRRILIGKKLQKPSKII